MLDEGHLPSWIALFIGLYAFAAGIGELRESGFFARIIREVETSRALRYLTGAFALMLGALVYLANPWRPDDWLSILITVIAGIAVVEGLLILAVGDRFLALARNMVGRGGAVWAVASILIGLALVAVGAFRV
jgi:hypothetical protein